MLRKLNSSRAGFTLVEVMIVVAIIALLATIAIPNFLRSRKRSQASEVLEDLRIIDQAKDQYAIEWNMKGNEILNWDRVKVYVKPTTKLYLRNGNDLFGASYSVGSVDAAPKAADATYTEFTDLGLTTNFWGAFGPAAAASSGS